jgi:CheY-like chemotaxis protein
VRGRRDHGIGKRVAQGVVRAFCRGNDDRHAPRAQELEVVQRIGYDSFTTDNGVLIAKNKDGLRGRNGGPNEFNSYIWVIDAHPEDIGQVDYVRPNGEKVMRTVADYRQLNDALFHAGLDSGSFFEWEDTPNRLHFYVVDLRKDKDGILVYTLAVRSLDGAGPQARGAALAPPVKRSVPKVTQANTPVTFALTNTGGAAAADAGAHFGSDVYRLSVSVDGRGWTAGLQNALAAVKAGAVDYLTKPFNGRELIAKVQEVLKKSAPKPTLDTLPPLSDSLWGGKSPAMRELYELVSRSPNAPASPANADRPA